MNQTLIIIQNSRQQVERFREVIHAVTELPGVVIHGFGRFTVGTLEFRIIPADNVTHEVRGLLLNKRILIHKTAVNAKDTALIVSRVRADEVQFVFTNTEDELTEEVRKEVASVPLVQE